MMNDVPALEGNGLVARALTHFDEAALQRVLESCTDYYDLVLGLRPGPAEAVALSLAGPEEGGDSAGKMLYGIWSSDGAELVGVLDAFADYPEPGVWYIGLLLFVPRVRSGGMGRGVMESLIATAQRLGARELQLNVVEQNQAGHRFWRSLGFSEVRRWRQHYGLKDSTFIRMRRGRQAQGDDFENPGGRANVVKEGS